MDSCKNFIRDLANEVEKRKIKGTEFLVKETQDSLKMSLIGKGTSSWPPTTIQLYGELYGGPSLGGLRWDAELWKIREDELPDILINECRKTVLKKYPYSKFYKVIGVKKDIEDLDIKKIADDLYEAYIWWKNMIDLYKKKKVENKIIELLRRELKGSI